MKTRQLFAITMAAILLMSGVGGIAAAETTHEPDFDQTPVQNPEITVDVTKAMHEVGWSAQEYEDDDGSVETLPAEINKSEDHDALGNGTVNLYSFTTTDINVSEFGEFPHDKEDVSALDASEWSGTASASDVETAPDVEAVKLDFVGNDDIQFSNFTVTSDETKRFLQIGLDATTVNSNSVLEFRVVDSDGDYYVAELNASRSSGEDFIAGSTGEGYFYQRQLGDMTLQTDGDGTFDDIESVKVMETGGAATTVEIAALNVEKMSPYSFGERYHDEDDDDELETEEIEEVKSAGDISIHDLDTMGSTFDEAEIRDLTIPMNFKASNLAAEEDTVNITTEEAPDYPSFQFLADVHYRLVLPDAYDLSYANAELVDEVNLPSSRYETVEYGEGVGEETDWDDISYSDVSSTYSSQGDDVSIDDTLQPGSYIAIHYEQLWTAEEHDNAMTSGVAGVTGPTGESSSLLDRIVSIPGVIIGGIAAFLGGRRFGVF